MPTRNTHDVVLLGKEYSDSTVLSEKYAATLDGVDDMPLGYSGHYGYPDFPIDRNVGGPFYLRGFRTERGLTASAECWRGGALKQSYKGHFIADPIAGSYGFPSGNIDASAWGATAYSRLKPTKPVFSGLNAIYELREVPEMLRQRFLSSGLASIGNYWLALQFGWKPLLQDIRNLVAAQRKAQERLKWLLENNGKPVRRRITLMDTSTDPVAWGKVFNYGALQPVLVTQYYAEQPWFIRKDWSSERVWASGRFKFWLPNGPRDILWTIRMIGRLYGLNPSPQMIYNMIPWSWLADWFTNAGDCLSILDAGVADRLAADYWYVMHEKANYVSYDCSGKFFKPNGSIFELTASAISSQYWKYRSAGSPFGFNVNPQGLTPMQLSIIGALGLSRSSG